MGRRTKVLLPKFVHKNIYFDLFLPLGCAILFISKGDRFPLNKERILTMIIPIDGNTRLESAGEKNGKVVFNEVYSNWPTGNTVTVAKGTAQAEVVKIYKETFPA